jgi:tetratricopeptide (TPR) repeat protein
VPQPVAGGEEWSALKPEPHLSAEGQATRDALLKRYSSGVVSVQSTGSVDIGALDVTVDLFKEEIDRAKTDFNTWNFVSARDRFLKVAEKADKLPPSEAINEVRMRARSGGAAAMLNLQETERAINVLSEVEERYLTEQQRANLSMMLTQAGDVARATVVANALPASAPETSAAKQLASIARGDLEVGEVTHTLVALKLCETHLEQQHPALAADVAMRALRSDRNRDLVSNGLMCALMTACCVTLVEQCAPEAGMSPEQLRSAVAVIERYALPPSVPDDLREVYVRSALQYAHVTLDHRLLAALRERFPGDLDRVVATTQELQADDLAKDGSITDAIGLVSGDPAGWRVQARRFHLMAMGGDTQAASKGLSELAGRYPNRFPIETLACEVALNESRFPDALAHAENAFALYPNHGTRLLLARSAVSCGKSARALDVVADPDVGNDPASLWVLAHAADRLSDPRAVALWEMYLRLRPDSCTARISWALALSRVGEHDRAADGVVAIIKAPPEDLSVEAIVACGQLQLAATPSDDRKARIRRIADLVQERFGARPEIQLHRFTLLAGIGEQQNVGLDYERLEATGHVQSMSFDDLLATFRTRAEQANSALTLYQEGCLTVEALIRVTDGRTASFVSELLAGRQQLRTSSLVGNRTERVPLAGRRVLVSLLELVLFENLGVLEHVLTLLGEGRLVVFDDVWSQLIEDAVFLQQVTQTEEADRLGSIVRRIATNSKYEIVRTSESDDEVAASRGVAWVRLTDETYDIGWLAGVVIARAAGPVSSARTFAQRHARPIPNVAPDSIPKVVQLDQAVIEGLALHGLLEAAEHVFERILVGPSSMSMLKSRLSRLEDELRAMKLMQSVRRRANQARTRGALDIVDRPRVPAVESLTIEDEKAEWTRMAIREPLAYKQWLVDEPNGVRVTAEYVGSLMPLHPELWKSLPWSSPDAAVTAWQALRQNETREWTLVEVVRALPDDSLRSAALSQLAELGFQEALDATELLSLVGRFGRLDIGRGGAALDRVESLVANPRDPSAGLARMRLAAVYANTIWAAIQKEDAPLSTQLTRELLGRAVSLGARSQARMAELLIGDLLLMSISDPMASMTDDENSDSMRLRKTGAIVEVWKAIREWSDGHEDRQAACRRAVSYGWVKLHEYTENGPRSTLAWSPLALATDKLLPRTSFERVPQADAAVATLSALWRERPLRLRRTQIADGTVVNLEELLQTGSSRFQDRGVSLVNESTARFLFNVGNERAVAVLVPVEALLLRAGSTEVKSSLARDLAGLVGTLDGRLYEDLVRFADHPDDPKAQSALAVSACTASFRFVRDDPSVIAFWGEPSNVSQQGHLATFDDLRELLSEPENVNPAFAREIKERVEDGIWASRLDAGELMQVAGRVPGRSVINVAAALVEQPPPGTWEGIGAALNDAATVPIGRLAQAVALAGLVPQFGKGDDAQRDFSTELRCVLEQLDSEKGKAFASVEAKSLALLERLVLRLAGIRPVPHHQLHWLTFRLYEWWCENSDFEERRVTSQDETGRDDLVSFRWSTVLNVLLDVCEMTSLSAGKRPTHLAALTEHLLRRATREPWKADPFEPFWRRPQGGGWTAASILLWISPAQFQQLPEEIRLRVFENLPIETEPLNERVLPYVSFLDGIVSNVDNLSEEEIRAVNRWLSKLGDSEIARKWRLHIWSRLVARGEETNHKALRDLVELEMKGERHKEFISQYVSSLARTWVSPEVVQRSVDWAAAACEQGGRIADGVIEAWHRDPDAIESFKTGLSTELLGRTSEHCQGEGAAVRDAAPLPFSEKAAQT